MYEKEREKNKQTNKQSRARFYTAEISLALSHLHSLGVIYRDLKPENLVCDCICEESIFLKNILLNKTKKQVLDGEGHVMLTDFGLAKTNVKGTTYTFCGTPEYMAPELVMKQGHTQAVDWWSLGIFLYEMVVGIPPFYTQNVSQMYQLILNKPLEFPSFVSAPLRDILTKLLDRDPKQRMCDIEKLKSHPFFSGIDFQELYKRNYKPEFIPSIHKGESDTKYFDSEFTKQATDLPGGDDEPGTKDTSGGKFNGFSYAGPKSALCK